MKRSFVRLIVTVLLAVLTMTVAAACTKEPGTEPGEETGKETGATERPTEEGFMYAVINGVRITSGGKAGDLIEALKGAGIEPAAVDEAESCMFDGKDVTYHFAFGDVFAFPQKSGLALTDNVVDEIYITASENVTVKGGVKVGDTVENVKEVFGDRFFMDGARMIYSESGDSARKNEEACIYFYVSENVVTGIGLLSNLYHVAA